MISIRKGEISDMRAIYDLVKELAIFEKEPEAVQAEVSEYLSAFEEGKVDAIVADKDGEIIGMVFYYQVFSTWKGRSLYLEDFIVKEEFRNEGLGQQLFDAYISEAKRLGCRQAKWQVLDWNEDAIRFYKKNGASIEHHWWNGRMILN